MGSLHSKRGFVKKGILNVKFEHYNKHYVIIDERNRITDAWSDGPHREMDTAGAICINERGGYQLRLIVDGVETEENPALWTIHGVPLYKYDEGEVKRRTSQEIKADISAIPPAPPSEMEQLRADVDYVMLMTDLI